MDEGKKILLTSEKAKDNNSSNIKRISNQMNKLKAVNFLEKKVKANNTPLNNNFNNASAKFPNGSVTERKSISTAKKLNSFAYNNLQKKLTTNSSVRNFDYTTKASNLLSEIKTNPNKNDRNSLNLANITLIPNVNSSRSKNHEENLKEKEIFNSINNTNSNNNQDNFMQINSLITAGNDFSPNQVSLLEQKNTYSLNAFSHHNSINNISTSSDSSHIKVVVRFRPMNTVENEMVEKKIGFKCVDFKSPETISITNSFNNTQNFTFDRVYDDNTTQDGFYSESAKPLIGEILKGYNGTIFTYGQSGSGKTYTMYGAELLDEETQGIIPRTISEIFEFINAEENKEIRFELKFSMLEIYQEQLYDLLNPETKSHDLKIKEHTKKGIYVENLSEVYISSQEEFLVLIHEAERCRIVKETGLNKCSSRSHLLFQLQITQKFPDDTERRGLLNLIDLAGSEKVSKTHAIGETLNEAKKINSSLSTLGKVISILATNTGEYVPYRESKLTRILQDSLGGNSKTILIVNCSIHSYNADETIYTLNFAKRAKKIKNKVKINIKHSAEQLEAIIEVLSHKLRLAHEEIARLKGDKQDINANSNNQVNFTNVNKSLEGSSLIKNLENVFNEKINNNNNTANIVARQSLMMGSGPEAIYEKELTQNQELIRSLNAQLSKKDEEISQLNDKLDALQQENKTIQEKQDNTHKQNNIDKYIESLDKSLKENLENLREIFLTNRKDEVETLSLRMKEIKKFYEDFEKNYIHLFRKMTDFKETEFDRKMQMILNDNFTELFGNQKNTNYGSKTNLNVNINNFNSLHNITINNQTAFAGNHIKADSKSKNNEMNRNIYEYSYKNKNDSGKNFDVSNKNLKSENNLQSVDSIVSPDKKPGTKRLSNEDPDSIVNLIKSDKRISTSKSGGLTFNNDSSIKNSNSSKAGNINNAPGNADKVFNNRCALKKGKFKKEDSVIPSNIPNPSGNRDGKNLNFNKNKESIENIDDYIQNEKEVFKPKNTSNHESRNFNSNKFTHNTDDPVFSSLNNNTNKRIFESYSSVNNTNNGLKINILSEALKKTKIQSNKADFLDLEFDNQENNCSFNTLPEFGGNLYNFNFNCDEIFKKIEMQLNAKTNVTSTELIVMSYKKLFSSNKIYSLKIFDEFLKRKEDYKLDLINNLHQNSLDNMLSVRNLNNITYTDNLFSRQDTINNLLFSPESKNNAKTNFNLHNKEDYFLSPNSNMTIKNKMDESERNHIKEFEKSQVMNDDNNLFSNKTINNVNNNNNINHDAQSKTSRRFNFDKNLNGIYNNSEPNNDNNKPYNFSESDYFLKMKNCIIKLMLKTIYFENLNHDLLSRLSIDLKIFHCKAKQSDEVEEQLEKITNIFTNYLEVLEELKKIKFRNEYEEKQEQQKQQQVNHNVNYFSSMLENNNNNNNPNTYESIPLLGNNPNNFNFNFNSNNCLTESSVHNNPIRNSPTKKGIVRLSTVQPEASYNHLLMQPLNMRLKQSRANLNNNIIKNITKQSSYVLNNLGYGFSFRKSVFEPNGSSPVLCQVCNNYYYANNPASTTKPFTIGINEDGNEMINNTLSNMNVSLTEKSADKNNNEALSNTKNKDMDPNIINSPIENKDLKENERKRSSIIKKKFNSKFASTASIDPELILSAESHYYNSNVNQKAHSKNVSFLLNEQEKKELNNKDNKNNADANTNAKKAFNILLRPTEVANFQDNNLNKSSKDSDKKTDNESKFYNESDMSMENFKSNKPKNAALPLLNEKPIVIINKAINRFNNPNPISDSNKKISLITAFNDNLQKQSQNPKINSTENSNFKAQLGLRKQNTFQNNELNDFELTNIKNKWQALRQSIISSTSNNNNFKMLKDENLSELKLAKKETVLYKNCFDSITTDYKKLKSNSKNFEKILSQDLENYKNLKEAETQKFAKALEMYNDLYSQQIKIKDLKIKQLANLIDQLVDKENYSLMNNLNNTDNLVATQNNLTILYTEEQERKLEYIVDKKNFILNSSRDLQNDENTEMSLIKLTDLLINQEGTATKKLDYITIELNDNPELIKFKYGSGLGHKLPTKSPLYRNLFNTLAGDQNNEVNITEVSD